MTPRILVAGGLNVDTLARLQVPASMRSSNPGRTLQTAGGVGRNVAANLRLLGDDVALAGVVGTDEAGDFLLASLSGIDTSRVRRMGSTGSYTAVIDHTGELVIGVADMEATESVTAADLGDLDGLSWLVLDGNLLPAAVDEALQRASAASLDVVIDPVGVAKAARLGSLHRLDVHTFTPNRDELFAFTGSRGLVTAVQRARERGVRWLWLREGPEGSRLYGPDGRMQQVPAYRGEVVDVTGAGDAMLAGYLHALGQGASPFDAAEYGAAAAALTVGSAHSVRPDLTDALVRRTLGR